jgi:hypothetical protein
VEVKKDRNRDRANERRRERRYLFEQEIFEHLAAAIRWHIDTTDWTCYGHGDLFHGLNEEQTNFLNERIKARLYDEADKLDQKARKARHRFFDRL